MEQYIKVLGKVCVTVNGDWDKDTEYERLCIVRNPINKKTYISKMFVPAGNELTDTTYWQYLIGGVEDNLTSTDPEQALSANMGRVLNEALNNAIKDYNSKITNLTNKHNQEITALTNKHNQEIAALTNKHNEDITNLTNKHNQDIDNLTDKHDEDITNLTDKHDEDVENLNEDINNAIKDYNNKITNLTNKHNQDIEAITLEHVDDINRLTNSINTLSQTVSANKAQHDTDINSLNNSLQNLSKQHSEDISELQTLVTNITSFEVEVVTALPTIGTKGIIYLVKSGGDTTDKAIYTEYIWIPSTNKYEILGEFETAVDLQDYQEKLISGSNIKTINGTSILGSGNINTTPAIVTTSAAGLMSADDKVKLNSIQSNAAAVSFERAYTSGTKIGTITINGVSTDIYIPVWNGTAEEYNAITNKQSDMIYNITD